MIPTFQVRSNTRCSGQGKTPCKGGHLAWLCPEESEGTRHADPRGSPPGRGSKPAEVGACLVGWETSKDARVWGAGGHVD